MLLSGTLYAAPIEKIRFDGFASFVVGPAVDNDRSTLGDYQFEPGYQTGTIFALQAHMDLQDGLMATMQIAAKGEDNFNAKLNWAYVTYEITAQWQAHLGRFRIPLFMYSDVLDVGYTYHWISPPYSVYNLSEFDSIDGFELDHKGHVLDWNSQISLVMGASKQDLVLTGESAESEIKGLGLLAISINKGWLTYRIAVGRANLQMSIDSLSQIATQGLSSQGVPEDVISKMLIDEDEVAFAGAGYSLDFQGYFIRSEYTLLRFESSILNDPAKQWYLSIGKILKKDISVYVTYENSQSTLSENERDEIIGQLPFGSLNSAASYVSDAFLSQATNYNSNAVGVRYDFHPQAAIKIEAFSQEDQLFNRRYNGGILAIDLVF